MAADPQRAFASLPERALICASCGTRFTCGSGGADGQCWCADEDFRMPMPANAAADCLCPQCLRAMARDAGEGIVAKD